MARNKEFCEVAALDRALQLFWQKGFAATSMQELVDSMGVSRSSIYSSYGNKEALYLKALKSYQEQNSVLCLRELIASEDPLESLKNQLILILQLSNSRTNKGCFMVRAMSEEQDCVPGLHDLICTNRDETTLIFSEIIQAGSASKKKGLIKQQATSIYTFFAGSQLMIANGMPVKEVAHNFKIVFEDIVSRDL